MTDRPPLITPGRPSRQYVPEVTLNTLILGAAVLAAPFIPVLFDAQRQSKQYVPDNFVNATIGLQTPLVPFVPAPLDQPSARRQYIPDVLANPVALGAVAPARLVADPRYYVQAKPEIRVIKGRAGIRVIVG